MSRRASFLVLTFPMDAFRFGCDNIITAYMGGAALGAAFGAAAGIVTGIIGGSVRLLFGRGRAAIIGWSAAGRIGGCVGTRIGRILSGNRATALEFARKTPDH